MTPYLGDYYQIKMEETIMITAKTEVDYTKIICDDLLTNTFAMHIFIVF